MTEQEARAEAFRRWGEEGFAIRVPNWAGTVKEYQVGVDAWVGGSGTGYEAAFREVDDETMAARKAAESGELLGGMSDAMYLTRQEVIAALAVNTRK